MNNRATQLRTAAVLIALLSAVLLPGQVAFAGDDQGGTWTRKSQSIKGSWRIVDSADGRYLELDDAFRTRRAPDLKLFLSPLPADEITANNATSGSVLIAPLKKAKGAQRYALPDGLDLDEFQTLVLHCEQYTKLWGVSPL